MTQLQEHDIAPAQACPISLSTAVGHAVETVKWASALRREQASILAAHWAGAASAEDLARYRTIRLMLGLHASLARRPFLSCAVDAVLRRREEVEMERMLGPEVAGPPMAS